MNIHLGIEESIDVARRIATEAALTSRYIHLPKPVVVLVNQVVEANCIAVRLRLKAYVLDTRYEKALETDVTIRVLDSFRTHRVKPPAILYRALSDFSPQSRVPTLVKVYRAPCAYYSHHRQRTGPQS